MARIMFRGIWEYCKVLEKLKDEKNDVIKSAVYRGAAIVADEIKAGLKTLPIEEGPNGLPPVGTPEKKLKGVSRRQKADLIDSFGLAPIRNDNGYIQTKAGVEGYGSVPTRNYPKGTPNVALMRSIESGTSFREKHPIFRQATNKAKKRAVEAMQKSLDEELGKRFK